MRRPPPRIVCAHGGRAITGNGARDIAVPRGQSTLEVALAVLDCFVNQHGAVLTGAEFLADGSGTYTIWIPTGPRSEEA